MNYKRERDKRVAGMAVVDNAVIQFQNDKSENVAPRDHQLAEVTGSAGKPRLRTRREIQATGAARTFEMADERYAGTYVRLGEPDSTFGRLLQIRDEGEGEVVVVQPQPEAAIEENGTSGTSGTNGAAQVRAAEDDESAFSLKMMVGEIVCFSSFASSLSNSALIERYRFRARRCSPASPSSPPSCTT